jgi:hypothetical protein
MKVLSIEINYDMFNTLVGKVSKTEFEALTTYFQDKDTVAALIINEGTLKSELIDAVEYVRSEITA